MERTNEKREKALKAYYQADKERSKQKKAQQKKIYKSLYDKRKTIEFKSGKEVNMTKHFRFPKIIGATTLPPVAQAIYPVLCSRADFSEDKSFQISRENISKLSGLGLSSVDKGLEILKSHTINRIPFLQQEMVQDGSRRYFTYQIQFPRLGNEADRDSKYFIFYASIIDSGIWASLSLRAKAFYIAARSRSFFDFEFFETITNWGSIDYIENHDEVDHSQWLVCHQSRSFLCKMANISASNSGNIVKELERSGLVDSYARALIIRSKPKDFDMEE